MATRNTSIAPSKLGIRLPFEHATVGTGYAASGPVKTYHMSQEEIIKRYGPIKGPRQVRNYTLYNYKLKEAKDMSLVDGESKLTPENLQNSDLGGGQDQEPSGGQPEKVKIALELARERITKEEYLCRKKAGDSDAKIYKELKIHPELFYKIKKEWNLMGVFKPGPNGGVYNTVQNNQEEVKKEPESLTITEAIELHDELEEEVECLDYLLTSVPVSLTRGIRLLLDDRRCEMARKLHRIHEVFEETKVAI